LKLFRSGVGVYSAEAGVESESKISDSVHLWRLLQPLCLAKGKIAPAVILPNKAK